MADAHADEAPCGGLQRFLSEADDVKYRLLQRLQPTEALDLCTVLGREGCRAPLPHARVVLRPLPPGADEQAAVGSWFAARFPRAEALIIEPADAARAAAPAAPAFLQALAPLARLAALGDGGRPLAVDEAGAGCDLAAAPALRVAHLRLAGPGSASVLRSATSAACALHLDIDWARDGSHTHAQSEAAVAGALGTLAAASVVSMNVEAAALGCPSPLERLTSLTRLCVRTDDRRFSPQHLSALQGLTLMTKSGAALRVRDAVHLTGLTSLAVDGVGGFRNELLTMAPALQSLSRLRHLKLRNLDRHDSSAVGGAQLALVARLPALSELLLEGEYDLGDDDAAAALRRLTGVTRLELDKGDSETLSSNPLISRLACDAIASLTKLRRLVAPLASEPAAAVRWSQLQRLEDLELYPRADDACPAFDGESWALQLTRLTRLVVCGDVEASFAAGAAARLPALRHLGIHDNRAHRQQGGAFVPALAAATGLTALRIGQLAIGDAGASELARLPRLCKLELEDCDVGDAGALTIAERAPGLTALAVGERVGSTGAAALARLPRLEDARLVGNVTDEGAGVLAEAATRLTSLQLLGHLGGSVQLTPQVVFALARLPRLRRLLINNATAEFE